MVDDSSQAKVRFLDEGQSRFCISTPTEEDPTLIKCPKCQAQAVVVPFKEGFVRAGCAECGLVKTKSNDSRDFFWHADNPTDGYFGYDLWMRVDCCGHSLWAFNIRHLDVLINYVVADLRKRQCDEEWGWVNGSLLSRLPLWVKSKKNRKQVLKSLEKMKASVKSIHCV